VVEVEAIFSSRRRHRVRLIVAAVRFDEPFADFLGSQKQAEAFTDESLGCRGTEDHH